MSNPDVNVSKVIIDDFQSDGVVVLRNVFLPWVEGISEAIEQNKRKPSWRERTYRPAEQNGSAFFQDYCVWPNYSGYRE